MNITLYRLLLGVRRASVGMVLFIFLAMAIMVGRLPSIESPPATEPDGIETVPAWPPAPVTDPEDWGVVRRHGGAPLTDSGPIAQRFRLAGTFFAYPGDQSPSAGEEGARRAILDDLRTRQQHLVEEGDDVEGATVVRIFRDHVVLRSGGGDESLWLSFTGGPAESRTASRDSDTPATPSRFEDMPALETSRFGKRIGENRWVFTRDALIAYADDLQDDPERLTAFFLAMEADYNEEEEISGWRLGMLGEDDLYQAAGFRNGDVVRMVNSIPMTSPARAQYFISEFLNGRISALVFDIERDGEKEKLIHLIR